MSLALAGLLKRGLRVESMCLVLHSFFVGELEDTDEIKSVRKTVWLMNHDP